MISNCILDLNNLERITVREKNRTWTVCLPQKTKAVIAWNGVCMKYSKTGIGYVNTDSKIQIYFSSIFSNINKCHTKVDNFEFHCSGIISQRTAFQKGICYSAKWENWLRVSMLLQAIVYVCICTKQMCFDVKNRHACSRGWCACVHCSFHVSFNTYAQTLQVFEVSD